MSQIDFDRAGPRIGPIRLVARDPFGFAPRSANELRRIFSGVSTSALDYQRLESALASIAHAQNTGDLGLAAIAATPLPFPFLSPDELQLAAAADQLLKARTDDPEHPGYPAGAPDREGGEFRPKEDRKALALVNALSGSNVWGSGEPCVPY